jgi:hypothetical protein
LTLDRSHLVDAHIVVAALDRGTSTLTCRGFAAQRMHLLISIGCANDYRVRDGEIVSRKGKADEATRLVDTVYT